jgi:hypothetical protein
MFTWGACNLHRTGSRLIPTSPLTPQLPMPEAPNIVKPEVWFRYDPPVLIIAATWHETRMGFGEMLHNRIAASYVGNLHSVRAHTTPMVSTLDPVYRY